MDYVDEIARALKRNVLTIEELIKYPFRELNEYIKFVNNDDYYVFVDWMHLAGFKNQYRKLNNQPFVPFLDKTNANPFADDDGKLISMDHYDWEVLEDFLVAVRNLDDIQ